MGLFRVDADILIVGNGETIKNGSLVIEGSKLDYSGEQEHAPKINAIVTAPVVMPGMWDCHSHFVGIRRAAIEDTVTTDPIQAALRCAWDAKAALESGITSTREVGGFGVYLSRAVNEGAIPGPRIYAAGSVISMTGGHGDIHNVALDAL
ncbi:MAG TPA: amidohydrolase family protein, partial [Candidatus Hodarchaeales archaeon]|nr:amidohydrolase family protein [Candidatus Hodarchaeales archaeon]